MPNYNISVVVDPSGAASGVNVVENNLKKLDAKARGTKAAVQGAFDFSATDAANKVSAVDKALDGMGTSATAAGRQVETAMSKAEAAAARANGRIVNSQAQVRQSTLSLGQQFNDFSTQVLAGGSVVTAFAQQSGQAAFAMQGFNGAVGTVGRFLAGPWGTILIIATTVLAGFVTKLIQQNDALDEAVKKLKEDAKEADTAAKAKDIYAKSADGVRAAVRDMNVELGKSILSTRQAEEATLASAKANQQKTLSIREELKATLELRRAQAQAQLDRANMPNQQGEAAALGLSAAQKAVSEAQSALDRNAGDLVAAQQAVRNALVPIAVRTAEELSTPAGRINRQYDQMKDSAIAAARGNDQLAQSLDRTLLAIERQRQGALESQRAQTRAAGAGDGVSRFRTRQQAIGIAGRELQGAGLRVSENEQFGGITSGVHSSTHRNAIDVNQGRGIVEADVPDLKEKFDQLARSYQQRGYRVIWNGQVYNPGGDGPGGSAAGHRDHLHIEAPQTIVGKATNASSATQQLAELRQLATAVEQQKDFIDSITDRAAQRGQSGVANSAAAEIERAAADFERRFNRAMTETERTLVETAINGAVARETAAYFDQAYVDPLKRLEALQGKVGTDRQVLNALLSETARLGRALTPVEAQQVENRIRQGDALQRQAQILADIRAPQEDYATRLAAINALLAEGAINQTSYNSRVSDLGQTARSIVSGMPGADPVSGKSYSQIGEEQSEVDRYVREQELFQDNRAQLLNMGISYDGLVEAARRRHVENLNNIDRERRSVAVQAAQSTFESLADIAKAGYGEQSAIYKTMFTISKAFAIADSIIKIQQGIANALALPFPANLGAVAAVAAQAASIISNIQAVTLAFADGGYVSGPGTGRSDSINAKLSNGEYVVNAAATKANRPLLDAINSGRTPQTQSSSGGGDLYINVGDVIVQGAGGDGQQIGRDVKQAIVGIVRDELGAQRRSGGALTKTRPSVMSGG